MELATFDRNGGEVGRVSVLYAHDRKSSWADILVSLTDKDLDLNLEEAKGLHSILGAAINEVRRFEKESDVSLPDSIL